MRVGSQGYYHAVPSSEEGNALDIEKAQGILPQECFQSVQDARIEGVNETLRQGPSGSYEAFNLSTTPPRQRWISRCLPSQDFRSRCPTRAQIYVNFFGKDEDVDERILKVAVLLFTAVPLVLDVVAFDFETGSELYLPEGLDLLDFLLTAASIGINGVMSQEDALNKLRFTLLGVTLFLAIVDVVSTALSHPDSEHKKSLYEVDVFLTISVVSQALACGGAYLLMDPPAFSSRSSKASQPRRQRGGSKEPGAPLRPLESGPLLTTFSYPQGARGGPYGATGAAAGVEERRQLRAAELSTTSGLSGFV